jgi:hypothetical protein
VRKPKLTEAEFQDQVAQLARLCGWRVVHIGAAITTQGYRTPWRYDGKGFPDLILIHPRRRQTLYAELKTEEGAIRPDQKEWLECLTNAGNVARTWRPSDWPEIQSELMGDLLPVTPSSSSTGSAAPAAAT